MALNLQTHQEETPRSRQAAQARPVLPGVLGFALGIAVAATWFWRPSIPGPPNPGPALASPGPHRLSPATSAVLARLEGPVDLRFYALLDPATVAPSLPAFAARVEQLLAAYESEAKGKLKITRYQSLSDNASAASADGLQPFNQDRGEACFLGVAIAADRQKALLARLDPDWESALEADLTRAIQRVAQPAPVAGPVPSVIDTNAVAEVKRAIPNLGSVSVEEGTQLLREAALKDYRAAAQEMQARVEAAQQQLSQARTGGSQVEQQAALEHLRQVQAEQTDRLQRIAARLQAQTAALTRLKQP
ncbi:MAG: Gldg family protein [Verrucomicrobia bacterium]|nr:Gldg family protein [Verrucomicrobiota bacterium]